jgi:hypothetical protein
MSSTRMSTTAPTGFVQEGREARRDWRAQDREALSFTLIVATFVAKSGAQVAPT